MKAKAREDAEAALADPLEVYRAFFLDGQKFIGGDSPSIADFRLAATLEFLRAIDYDVPGLGRGVHERHGVDARRGLLRARRGRARLHRVRQAAGRVIGRDNEEGTQAVPPLARARYASRRCVRAPPGPRAGLSPPLV